MPRTMHDSFAKEWMQEMLTDFGQVEIEKQLAGEVRKIDVYFSPNPAALGDLTSLGLLGRMVTTPAILEPFRNPASEWDIRGTREKLFQLEAELARDAKRKKQKFLRRDRPFAWVLSPTFSKRQQTTFHVVEKKAWGPGIYFLPSPDRTAVVAIHQLPKTIDTLFLRLLGRDKVQADAVAELIALPLEHPYRSTTLHHISRLQINLQVRQNKTKDLWEIMMNLAPAYDKWLAETETKTQTTIALRMLDLKMPIETIAQVTGLSIEVVQSLRSADAASS